MQFELYMDCMAEPYKNYEVAKEKLDSNTHFLKAVIGESVVENMINIIDYILNKTKVDKKISSIPFTKKNNTGYFIMTVDVDPVITKTCFIDLLSDMRKNDIIMVVIYLNAEYVDIILQSTI